MAGATSCDEVRTGAHMVARSVRGVAAWLGTRPAWLAAQRWVTGTVLGGLGIRLALGARR